MQKPWNEWDLNQWLEVLENRTAHEIQLGLTRIMEVAKKNNLHKPDCKVITVAGTNGKGSTVTALETIYHAAGYKVGSYTSPHLLQFNERIRVNLIPISDNALCQSFSFIEELRAEVALTYFEMATLAALWYFKQLNLDIIILEVGLGGRLDATNIVDADISIITTIHFDHQEYLGNTLDAIGYEKAGILRKGKPFIYADNNPPTTIINVGKELSAPAYVYGNDYTVNEYHDEWELCGLHLSNQRLPKPKIQLKSAAAAVVACSILNDYLPVSSEQFHSAMSTIFIAGRLQLQKGPVSVLYDVSHNSQSAKLLANYLHQWDKKGRIFAVFSALKDKDILGLIIPLKDCVDRWYPAQLENNRAASAEMLLTKLREAEIFVEICYTSPLSAFETALSQAKAGDLIVVYGSFFTVSHVLLGIGDNGCPDRTLKQENI